MSSLRRLDLDGFRNLTDEWLTCISTQLVNLTELNIFSLDSSITEGGLREVFTNLTNLRSLNVAFCLASISDENVFDLISNLKQLTSLTIGDDFITDDVLHYLSRLPSLTELNIPSGGSKVTDDGIRSLFPLSTLKHLNLGTIEITDGCLHDLCMNWTQLESFSISLECVTAAGVCSINNLTKLTALDLASGTQEGLMSITKLRRLQSLSITEWKDITEDFFIGISQLFPLLKSLFVWTSLKRVLLPNGFRSLQSLKCLSNISLYEIEVTEDSAKEIAKITSLKTLRLTGSSSLTDGGMTALSASTLTHLHLSNCSSITDVGMSALSSSVLTHLHLFGCSSITDDGVMELLKSTRLKSLGVCHCPRITKRELFVKQFPSILFFFK